MSGRLLKGLLIGAGIGTALALLFKRQDGQPLLQRAIRFVRRTRLEDLTRDELYARAQEADIPGRSEMTKDELLKALAKAES